MKDKEYKEYNEIILQLIASRQSIILEDFETVKHTILRKALKEEYKLLNNAYEKAQKQKITHVCEGCGSNHIIDEDLSTPKCATMLYTNICPNCDDGSIPYNERFTNKKGEEV